MKLSKEIKSGLIAVLAILSFVLLFQFMKGKSLFTTDNVFYAKYDNVEGLEPSSPVTINGLKVGQVDQIKPIASKNGKIHFVVKFTVNNEFEFSKKSTVEVFEPGLMAGKALRINLAYEQPFAKNSDTLTGTFKLSMLDGLSSQVGPVKDQLQEVLKRVDSLANSANKVLGERNRAEIAALLTSLNRTVSSFEGTSKNANLLMSNNDSRLQKVLDNASATMITANSAVDKYGNLAQSIDAKKLNETIANLDATISKLNGVVGGIENGNGTMGKLMKDEALYNNLTKASNSLNELMSDLKENPKKYINISVFGKNNTPKEKQ